MKLFYQIELKKVRKSKKRIAKLTLEITIINARNIKAADVNGKSDGYVTFKTDSTKKQKTKIFKPSLNPD